MSSAGGLAAAGTVMRTTLSRKKRSVRKRPSATRASRSTWVAAITRASQAQLDQPADAAEGLVLEETEQLGLAAGGEIADLVEHDRAAVGELEQPLLLLPGVGEGAPLVAEQLALQELVRQRRAIDGDEELGRSAARGMDGSRHDLLARSALALDQDGGLARGEPRDRVANLRDRARVPDEAVRLGGARDAGAPPPRRPGERPGHHVVERLHGEGLHEKVGRAELHRLDRQAHGPVRGHHDHRQIRMERQAAPQRLDAVDAAQPDVEEHQIGADGADQLDGLARPTRRSPPS